MAATMLTAPIAAPGASGRSRCAPASAGANGMPAASPTTAAATTISGTRLGEGEHADCNAACDEARGQNGGAVDESPAERARDDTDEEHQPADQAREVL